MRFICLLMLASVSLFAAGAGSAEQREAMVLSGPMSPMTERPTAVNDKRPTAVIDKCTLTVCMNAGVPECNAICSKPKQGVGDACGDCRGAANARCMAQYCP
jgi:hypothetical protein